MSDRLALGTAQFGLDYGVANRSGRVSADDVGGLLAEAARCGIDTLDTAIAYGDSEAVLGRTGVAGWRIITKLPAIPDPCSDITGWVRGQVEGSLGRLGVDQLHAVLLHRPDQLLGSYGKELFAALKHLKTLGYTAKIGVSVYDPGELDELFGNTYFDLVQAPLNILDQRLVSSGWAQRLKRQGVELHSRSSFLQGLLLMSAQERPQKFVRWNTLWAEWTHWLNKNNLSPLQACLRYALSVAEIDRVIVGVDGMAQFREIQMAFGGALPSLPNWPQPVDLDLINPSHWGQL